MKTILRSGVLSVVLALGAQSAMADVTVSGDYLKFGVGSNGSLIDFGSFTGLQFDPTGMGNFSSGIDFLTPGIPFAFYSIGVNGSSATAGAGGANNPFGSVTGTFNAAGTSFVITSGGTYSGLKVSQTITFDLDSKVVHTAVLLKNISGGTLNNVVYGTGFDPDQDVYAGGSSVTMNQILGQGLAAEVEAFGPTTGYNVSLRNTSGWANTVASISVGGSGGWVTDPYVLSGAVMNGGNGDNAISLGYSFGNLGAGKEIAIGYDLTVSAVPEPETYAMMAAGLGLLGMMSRRRRRSSK